MVKQLIVDLCIPREEYLKLYQGIANTVNAVSRDGKRVHFPANILLPYVERDGVRGSFLIEYDEFHRFQQVRRLSDA